jgi:hypothetical protein
MFGNPRIRFFFIRQPLRVCVTREPLQTDKSVSEIAAGPRQHSKSLFRVPSGPIFLFFPGLLRVLKWDLLFNERRGLTPTGHSPSTGGNWSGHSLANWPSPPPPRTRTHTYLIRARIKVKSKLLYDWQFPANQFVLALSPLRPTTTDFSSQLNPFGNSPYVTSSPMKWVRLLLIRLAFRQVYVSHI